MNNTSLVFVEMFPLLCPACGTICFKYKLSKKFLHVSEISALSKKTLLNPSHKIFSVKVKKETYLKCCVRLSKDWIEELQENEKKVISKVRLLKVKNVITTKKASSASKMKKNFQRYFPKFLEQN